MRISTRRKPWLVAALGSLLGSASVANANRVDFPFPQGDVVSNPQVAVYYDYNIPSKPVPWFTNPVTNIDTFNLYVMDDGKPRLIGSSSPSASSSSSLMSGGGGGGGGSIGGGVGGDPATTVTGAGPTPATSSPGTSVVPSSPAPTIYLTVSGSEAGTGNVTISNISNAYALANSYPNMVLYFEAVLPNNAGSSYSRAFNVANGTSFASASLNPVFSNSSPVLPDSAGPSNSGSNSTGIQPAPTSTTSTPAEGGTAEKGGEGGLPKGAIAGIAIACGIVGLALIAGCCWWFCVARPRRRQQQQQDDAFAGGTYTTDRSRTQELIAEKEANGGVEVSPHSPYSDDGGMMAANGTTAAAVAAPTAVMAHHHQLQQQTHDRSYSPYSDDRAAAAAAAGERGVGGSVPPSTHAPSVLHAEGDPRTSTASGIPVARSPTLSTSRSAGAPVSAQYAHLVEEGMTEDEIRRLEEEERQLDAAIEQAGRR
ncbi:hypothetical protein QBC46DRAFT_344935 [Diplogelasinospora grovesii]|uniref:Mid2 domain-containing protein n=1 Tax=Diplogelasinospora grovesii TaxID=303347 RepID=A0AAN6N0V3_9PEZI|nr:hypothetical protein QBC46DRAFT_344935 [Diplogelasinospora grovesii]